MSTVQKIEYYDLREAALEKRVPALIGRREETERLDRVIRRRINNNAIIVGEDGIGKTTLVYGWVRRKCLTGKDGNLAFLQFGAEHLRALEEDTGAEERYAEAFSTLPACVLFIDDFGRAAHRNSALVHRVQRLYADLLKRPDVHVVLTLEPQECSWLEREHPAFARQFEIVALKKQRTFEHRMILVNMLARLNARERVIVPDTSLQSVVEYAERYPGLGQMPQSAIRLLDESIAQCAAKGLRVLREDSIAEVVEAKTGVPKARLGQNDLRRMRSLEANLNARIIGQEGAIAKIAATLQRAKLGLRNPNRPLGSFLLLGPSGVGKTETAKCVAEMIFGNSESFLRFDMSEFQQEHTVQRLIGAPSGYVGYEEGGALTSALKKNPHCLILLDEIEKAHPKVFDVFLQVLDDGRLTSGQNETVDAKNAIIMATSNAGVSDILRAVEKGADPDDESFVREKILPALTQNFRLEFINRFDNILVFRPLSAEGLARIAEIEIRKIEKRVSKHRVRFDIEPQVIAAYIERMADPRFGARPVKRFVEETCETLLVQSLLSVDAPRV